MKLIKILSWSISTIFGVTLIAFFMVRMAPGDPVLLMVGERGADPAYYQEVTNRLHLNQPLPLQYFGFLSDLLHGNFGRSIVSGRSVVSELSERWPATIELGVLVIVISMIVGVTLGVFSALRKNSFSDYLITNVSLIGYSTPVFWLGLLLILFFSVYLDLTPVSGRIASNIDVENVTGFMMIDSLMPSTIKEYGLVAFYSSIQHIILPVLTMAIAPTAAFIKMTRASMLKTMNEDYIRTAVAKGLTESRIIWIHALRNALIPIITTGGLFFVSAVIGGAIITETIFSWPGIGKYIVSSVHARDYPVIQSAVLLIGLSVIVTNLIVEFLYGIANPKMRKK